VQLGFKREREKREACVRECEKEREREREGDHSPALQQNREPCITHTFYVKGVAD
jgi:hypothetical protein